MNWIDNFVRPKIRSLLTNKRETPENLWVKDPESGEMVFYRDLEANQWVVPNSGYHMKIKPVDRLATFLDDGKYELVPVPSVPADPLKFRAQKRYADQIRENRAKTGFEDAVLVATGKLYSRDVTVAVQDFDFMAGSLGMAGGQGIITGLETAVERRTPFILFVASGGARMQEGVLGLMQMPRTTVAVLRLREAGLPFFVVLTNPTTAASPPPMPCWATCTWPSRARSSALPASASSNRRSARSSPRASSAPNISTSTAWSIWSCTGTTCARPSARSRGSSPRRRPTTRLRVVKPAPSRPRRACATPPWRRKARAMSTRQVWPPTPNNFPSAVSIDAVTPVAA